MAGTWECQIAVVNLARKIVRIRGTRTEGEEPDVVVRTYTLGKICVDTSQRSLAEIRDEVVTEFQKLYAVDTAREAQVAAMLEGWETALADALNAAEA